jgi:hypothetical protein
MGNSIGSTISSAQINTRNKKLPEMLKTIAGPWNCGKTPKLWREHMFRARLKVVYLNPTTPNQTFGIPL